MPIHLRCLYYSKTPGKFHRIFSAKSLFFYHILFIIYTKFVFLLRKLDFLLCIMNIEINYQLSFIFALHNSALVDIIHTFHYLADLRKSLSAGHKTVLELLSRLIFFAIYTSITVPSPSVEEIFSP